MSDTIRKALAELVTLHLDESPRQPGDDADAWADAWAAARAALAKQPSVMEPLTDEVIQDVINSWWRDDLKMKYAQLCRLIERAHGIGVKGEA